MNMDIKELQNCVIAVAIWRKNDAKKRNVRNCINLAIVLFFCKKNLCIHQNKKKTMSDLFFFVLISISPFIIETFKETSIFKACFQAVTLLSLIRMYIVFTHLNWMQAPISLKTIANFIKIQWIWQTIPPCIEKPQWLFGHLFPESYLQLNVTSHINCHRI